MYIISELVDILNKISDVNIWKYCQGMFVAEYWIDSGQVALAWRWRHPEQTDHREQDTYILDTGNICITLVMAVVVVKICMQLLKLFVVVVYE